MFDRVNFKLTAYTDSDGTVYNSVGDNSSFPQLDLSTFQGTARLFNFDLSTPQVKKYSFPELVLLNQRNFTETVFGGVTSGNLVFVMLQALFSENGFLILNAQTLSTIDAKQGFPGNRNLAIFEGDTIIALEISDAAINRYKINSVGKVIDTDQLLSGVNQPSSQNTCDIHGDYYIGGRFATIVNKDADIITSLLSGVNEFAQLCRFSPDGTQAAVLLTDNNVVSLELYDITNLPATSKIKTYSLPNTTYADVYFRDDVIHIIGVSFNAGTSQTFFLQLPK
jgi:hypothetical protein